MSQQKPDCIESDKTFDKMKESIEDAFKIRIQLDLYYILNSTDTATGLCKVKVRDSRTGDSADHALVFGSRITAFSFCELADLTDHYVLSGRELVDSFLEAVQKCQKNDTHHRWQ